MNVPTIAVTGLLAVMAYRTFRCPKPLPPNSSRAETDKSPPVPEGVHVDTPMNTEGQEEIQTVSKVNSSTINRIRRLVNDQYARDASTHWGVNTFAKMVCK